LDQLTSAQLSEWEAYDRLDPVGQWREDLRWAALESLLANISRAVYGKKGTKMTTFEDFLPTWDKEKFYKPPVQSLETMKEIMVSITKDQNKKVEREEKLKRQTPPVKKDKR